MTVDATHAVVGEQPAPVAGRERQLVCRAVLLVLCTNRVDITGNGAASRYVMQ